jgi:SAM-dependent methyltransferase
VAGPPEFRGFSDVDRTGRAGVYADYLDQVRGLEAVAEWKERSFAALAPRPGAVLLDVGCGTGEDVRTLARRVVPGGRAIGVDASEGMVAEARRRAAAEGAEGAEFVRADVRALPLGDGAADGSRAERVLQHLDDPAAAWSPPSPTGARSSSTRATPRWPPRSQPRRASACAQAWWGAPFGASSPRPGSRR